MGAGVAVAADDGEARQADALLRPDDVDDALPRIQHREVGDAELGHVALQGFHLQGAFRLGDADAAVRRLDIVVRDGDGGIGAADPAASQAQALERLRAGDLVHEVAVYVEDAGPVRHLLDHVRGPHLVEQRAGGWGHAVFLLCFPAATSLLLPAM